VRTCVCVCGCLVMRAPVQSAPPLCTVRLWHIFGTSLSHLFPLISSLEHLGSHTWVGSPYYDSTWAVRISRPFPSRPFPPLICTGLGLSRRIAPSPFRTHTRDTTTTTTWAYRTGQVAYRPLRREREEPSHTSTPTPTTLPLPLHPALPTV
jgi:hypothetical protein